MENTHLSNSALKFAKPAKIVTYQQFYFSRKKKARHLLAPSSSIHVALFFLTEALRVQRGEQIWLRIALLLGTRKNWEHILGTVGPLFFSFLPKTDYSWNLLGTLRDVFMSAAKP